MTAVKGAVRTDFDAVPRVIAKPSKVGGVPQHMYDEYEASGLASGSTITVGVPLPIGARIKNVSVMHDTLTTSSTLKVGDAGNDDRYLTAFAADSGGKQTMLGTYGDINGWFYEITGTDDTDIIITTGGASITGTIKIDVEYVMV